MYTRKELIVNYQKGKRLKYLFFWKLNNKSNKNINESCLSQWYPAGFTIDEIYYPTAEHYMMVGKAKLFDVSMIPLILNAKTSKEVKQLGRKIENFNELTWKEKSFDIVVQGNLEKFSQNINLKNFLINTSKKIIVEASPYDKIWGIGLEYSHRHAKNPLLWKGDNKLGFVLMKVRDIILLNDSHV